MGKHLVPHVAAAFMTNTREAKAGTPPAWQAPQCSSYDGSYDGNLGKTSKEMVFVQDHTHPAALLTGDITVSTSIALVLLRSLLSESVPRADSLLSFLIRWRVLAGTTRTWVP